MSEERIVGVWGLVAQVYEDVDSGERVPIFGDAPRGRQIATKDGRWLALATGGGRGPRGGGAAPPRPRPSM